MYSEQQTQLAEKQTQLERQTEELEATHAEANMYSKQLLKS